MHFTQLNKSLRRERIDRRLKPQQHGLRRLQRHLLFEDDVYECGESGWTSPHRRRAIGPKNPRQCFVSRSQMLRRLDQRFRR
jgi:hypothetical protein